MYWVKEEWLLHTSQFNSVFLTGKNGIQLIRDDQQSRDDQFSGELAMGQKNSPHIDQESYKGKKSA